MKNLTGKVALITGGNSGIGYAAAKQLKENGAQVIITGRRKDAVEKAASDLRVTGFIANQSSLTDIEALAAAVGGRFSKIDILVVNAGVTKFSPIEHMPEAIFDEVMNVNFKGAYFTLSKFIPILNENASVILLSSTSAHISPPQASVYAASKAALNAVMKIAALELSARKIRINAVSPGPVATEIMDKIELTQSMEDHMIGTIPLARFGKAEEVAKLIAFLASDEASFITGSEYLIDGGQCI
ncbi:SDR family oxidoreductase [Pedobacter riviphilus]|uniref:SDR family oxidoreductase n=1 Tax=Pedobacter riviphilus TaxID=2766984 RepID=A0ABX6TLZ8_9SPHI|nr:MULTISPECIES: SDR family oxidoreductase [Pedobacter]NII82159.1 NAD(P)-dependent dehydrogenase (short-subunit alcohol dehydrogenase family) [Pedobacter sp. SG908]NMN36177.1 NAD(P)-dependent dehydrogenase (short-subunit alcohol dehydrogenase family) [Pedobacter sp. SG918]QNR85948.1 SDR family oxidoreductase [Pedobacter riviphilus]